LIGYMDANGNGRPDGTDPAEPVYFDLDGTHTVTYGDVRLSGFLHYAAGTWVNITNSDVGRVLVQPTGWFGTTALKAWVLDLDNSRSLTVGDLRMDPFGTRVQAGETGSIEPAQAQTSGTARVGHVDLDGDRARAAGEPIYLDTDPSLTAGSGRVSTGDMRLTPSGPGLDDAPTRAEFDALQRRSGVDPATGTATSHDSGWHGPQLVLLALGLLDLAGVAYVYSLVRKGAPPHNPFK
jgi:hypothetical protein